MLNNLEIKLISRQLKGQGRYCKIKIAISDLTIFLQTK
ncbi:hypothetical protein ENT_04200 [Enterococcus faecalis]|nr:hypothetical protein ENT_04200 [Enterococcus faecalis]